MKVPTIGSLVRYRARSKRDNIGIVVCFEPKDLIKGATRVLWLNQGVYEWLRWSTALEIIA